MNVEAEITGLNKDVKSLEYRMEKIEDLAGSVHEIAISVKLMAQNQDNILKEINSNAEKLDNQDKRITSIENKPSEDWGAIKKAVMTALTGGLVGVFLTQIFK